MNSREFIDMLLSEQYQVWNGVHGYDTRPFVKNGAYLPVPYWEGFAAGDIPDTGDVGCGDIEAFLNDLPNGSVIVVPEYHGSNFCGANRYFKDGDNWDLRETLDEDGHVFEIKPNHAPNETASIAYQG